MIVDLDMPRLLRVTPSLRSSLLVLGVLALAAPADAGTLGLVVAGDPAKQPVIESTLEPWLSSAGHEVRLGVLDKKEVDKIVTCFILRDQICAGPHAAGAGVATLMFVMVELNRDTRTGTDEIKLTGWLFSGDGKPLFEASVYCRDCRNDTLGPTAEDLARDLLKKVSVGTGRLTVVTVPAGARVSIDSTPVGATPLDHGLRAGHHVVDITLDGHKDVRREIEVSKDKVVPIEVQLEPGTGRAISDGGKSKGPLPYVAIAGGVALLGTGVAFYLMDQDCVAGGACDVSSSDRTYRDTAPLGIGLAAGGAAVLGAGIYLALRTSPPSSPRTVGWVTPRGGGLGVTGRF
jgi:hypothetical protein